MKDKDIILKPLQYEDIELVRNWRNSEEVSQYMYTDSEISEERQKQWFESVKKDFTQKYWLIIHKDKKLGVANLYNIKDNFKTTYWGFYLGDTSVRGQGVGKKVEFNMLKMVFDDMQYNKLLCEVFVSNDAVIKMHEKFGFRREGYFRQHILKNNTYHDVVSMAMLKSEWLKLKPFLLQNIYS